MCVLHMYEHGTGTASCGFQTELGLSFWSPGGLGVANDVALPA